MHSGGGGGEYLRWQCMNGFIALEVDVAIKVVQKAAWPRESYVNDTANAPNIS